MLLAKFVKIRFADCSKLFSNDGMQRTHRNYWTLIKNLLLSPAGISKWQKGRFPRPFIALSAALGFPLLLPQHPGAETLWIRIVKRKLGRVENRPRDNLRGAYMQCKLHRTNGVSVCSWRDNDPLGSKLSTSIKIITTTVDDFIFLLLYR